ncbi:glycosyltransferase [Fructilactobacillus sanfranciscensis]|uniref:glycosyltransferase n=1 Tax=Fructilactobacillus sanfranciscensis TaxID=1625 RepID=UPI0013D3B080|nr:glycosyltransferase [Fructilactobacillus sanfranciscensis]
MSYASVIVTFNRKDLLKKAINSVLTQTYAPTYVIVVDNHSTDGTDELMTTFASRKEIVYVRTSENVGGSMGFYLGTDWVSLSDDDAIFETHYFEKLLVASKQKPEVKCFTGTVKSPNETIQDVHRRKLLNTATLREKLFHLE